MHSNGSCGLGVAVLLAFLTAFGALMWDQWGVQKRQGAPNYYVTMRSF